ncbi:unnamed protein product [Thlaspi arvense]|uniref:Uncharacterized protein n=1 Tax=Thlaspi arvense TaxID=13288 RepID=A0AAU9S8U1_THLAR|nr:unnamed protein product [Thlaspi arvense]
MYSLLLDTYIKDTRRETIYFAQSKTIPCIAKKAQWAKTWIDRSQTSAERIVAFACIKGLHCDFACLIYTLLRTKLSEERMKAIVCDAVEIEREFVCDALSYVFVGMNRDLMSHYIKFFVDRLLDALRYGKVYDVANPFDWMELISLEGKTNFFQKRVGVHQKSSVMTKASFSIFAKFKEENIYNNQRLCPLMNSRSTISKPNPVRRY